MSTPVPASAAKAEKVTTDKQTVNPEKPAPVVEASAPSSDNVPETNDAAEEGKVNKLNGC